LIVLGINTSTLEGSVALVDEKRIIGEHLLGGSRSHSERLIPAIDSLLQESDLDLSSLSGIAVAIGPGSFTGLRIGLATAKGLALASSASLLGIPTLEAMARNLPFCCYPICPLISARKGEVYWALYRFDEERMRCLEEEAVSPPEGMARSIREKTVFIGDGAVEFWDRLQGMLGRKAILGPSYTRTARASVVAEMGLERLRRGECDDPGRLLPRYIRRSEAEIKWGIRIEGQGVSPSIRIDGTKE
jgi:tRNA threonylcarbamoyladenosine biosynthesis protein TsaB